MTENLGRAIYQIGVEDNEFFKKMEAARKEAERYEGIMRKAATGHDAFVKSTKQVEEAQNNAAKAAQKHALSNDDLRKALLDNGVDKAKKKNDELADSSGKSKKGFDLMGAASMAAGQLMAKGMEAGAEAIKKVVDFAIQANTAMAKMQGQLGLTKTEAAGLGQVAQNVFKTGMAESIGEATDAVVAARREFKNMSNIELQGVAEKALTLKTTFGVEIGDTFKAISPLIKNFGLDANTAFDIVTKSFQKGGDQAQDLLDTIQEYSSQFKNAGFSAQEFSGILVTGLENGAHNADKVADSIKEFGIRIKDGSDTSRKALEGLGLSWQDIETKLGNGSLTTSQALSLITGKLTEMKDTTQQNQLGVALFGTQWEDVGPKVILSLDSGRKALGDFEGATKQATATLEQSFGVQLQAALNSAMVSLEPFGQSLLGMAQGPLASFIDGAVKIGSVLEKLAPIFDIAIKIAFFPLKTAIDVVVVAINGIIKAINLVITAANALGGAFGVSIPQIREITVVSDAAQKKMTELGTATKTVAEAFSSGKMSLAAKTELANITTALKNEDGNVRKAALESSANIVEAYKANMSKLPPETKAIMDKFIKEFEAARAGAARAGDEIGTSAGRGILEGFQKLIPEMVAKAAEAVKAMLNSAQNAQRSHSPSEDWDEKIGQSAGVGGVRGLGKTIPLMEAKAKEYSIRANAAAAGASARDRVATGPQSANAIGAYDAARSLGDRFAKWSQALKDEYTKVLFNMMYISGVIDEKLAENIARMNVRRDDELKRANSQLLRTGGSYGMSSGLMANPLAAPVDESSIPRAGFGGIRPESPNVVAPMPKGTLGGGVSTIGNTTTSNTTNNTNYNYSMPIHSAASTDSIINQINVRKLMV